MIDQSKIKITVSKDFDNQQVINLYEQNEWSSAKKPELLIKALKNSFSLVLAYYDNELVGLGNAISDGYLVVYYPHLLVRPDFHGKGIGKLIVDKFQEKFGDIHMQMLTADGQAIQFYEKCGFERAGQTEPMWIYQGDEH